MRMLVVEDDRKLADFLARAFGDDGWVVDTCRTGSDALVQASSVPYDLLVLDWMLPGGDGLSVCRELRARGVWMPVMMLTARTEPAEKVLALNAGADDYVVKPFAVEELLARARVLLRRSASAGPALLSAGPLILDERARTARVGERAIDLTSREFALLAHFVRNRSRVVSRTEILATVWGMKFDPGSNVVDVHVRNLREKLASEAWLIETVRGQGYRIAPAALA